MNILGVGGLEHAMAFKKAHGRGLDEREYRISQGHDAAAALVMEGVPVAAAAEERFNRQKHSARFPVEAIGFCLGEAGLALDDIDLIAPSFDYAPYRRAYSIDPPPANFYSDAFYL